MITQKEYGTIIFALENYQLLLEKEGNTNARNNTIDLIHKVCKLGESGGVVKTREELLEILRSILDNEGQYAADKVLDIRELLEEEGNE